MLYVLLMTSWHSQDVIYAIVLNVLFLQLYNQFGEVADFVFTHYETHNATAK